MQDAVRNKDPLAEFTRLNAELLATVKRRYHFFARMRVCVCVRVCVCACVRVCIKHMSCTHKEKRMIYLAWKITAALIVYYLPYAPHYYTKSSLAAISCLTMLFHD
jgi:hypothetical protein